jgi:hypothetical protein
VNALRDFFASRGSADGAGSVHGGEYLVLILLSLLLLFLRGCFLLLILIFILRLFFCFWW